MLFRVGNMVSPFHAVVRENIAVNGGFDADTDWAKAGEATIAGGVANILSSGGSWSAITQTNAAFTVGADFIVNYTIKRNAGGTLKLSFTGGAINTPLTSTVGSHSVSVNNDGSVAAMVIGRVSGVTDIDIDDIVVWVD